MSNLPNYNQYKCRAECPRDVIEAKSYLEKHYPEQLKNSVVEPMVLVVGGQEVPIPDVDWSFSCTLEYKDLTEALIDSGISDIHVLCESLKPANKYDGKRNNPYC